MLRGFGSDSLTRRIATVSIAALAVVLAVLLPVLPGGSLAIANSLAVLALFIGMSGVLLVPLGIILALWRRRRGSVGLAPAILIVLPLVVWATRLLLLPPAVRASRERAMDRAAPMIAAIEAYHQRVGRYPVSLLAQLGDYDTGIIGIPRYLYEPSGAAYNLIFEQPTDILGTREFVIYNRLGEQDFSAHDADLLELSSADVARQRGYYSRLDAGRPHWKRFLFD